MPVNVQTIQSLTTAPPAITNSSDVVKGKLCKAWVNYNAIGTVPVPIRASFNIPSITRNGVGGYMINITPGVLADTNFCLIGSQTYPQGAYDPHRNGTGLSIQSSTLVYQSMSWVSEGSSGFEDMTQGCIQIYT